MTHRFSGKIEHLFWHLIQFRQNFKHGKYMTQQNTWFKIYFRENLPSRNKNEFREWSRDAKIEPGLKMILGEDNSELCTLATLKLTYFTQGLPTVHNNPRT